MEEHKWRRGNARIGVWKGEGERVMFKEEMGGGAGDGEGKEAAARDAKEHSSTQ